MKPSICLTFKVHEPARLRLYRFFDIGKESHYYDDFANRSAVVKAASSCYLPMNELLLKLVRESKGRFKVAFAVSGTALELFDRYCPEVIDGFRELNETGCAEFLCEPYYHSMAAVGDNAEFLHQIKKQKDALKTYIGAEAKTFVNTDMVYTDAIGEKVQEAGFNAILTEGARHILGWRSPNFVYRGAYSPKLKLLLRNAGLSDDISLRFDSHEWDEWPLTAEKYYGWLCGCQRDQVVNICLNYKLFGDYFNKDTGIFDFFGSFVNLVLKDGKFNFATPAEAASKTAVDSFDVQDPVSCEDEERDMAKWLGNELQKDAFNKLYALREELSIINLPQLWEDYGHLQESDHFYNMNTKFFSDGGTHRYVNPYDTPYEAFINYMNVLADFALRVRNESN